MLVGSCERRVTLVGFGTFAVSRRAARSGRNPRTGEAVEVKPKRLPKFKVGKDLERIVDESRAVKPELDADDGDDE